MVIKVAQPHTNASLSAVQYVRKTMHVRGVFLLVTI